MKPEEFDGEVHVELIDDELRDDLEDNLSPFDRRMVRALATADSARKGVVMLRVVAAVVAASAIVGVGLRVMEPSEPWMPEGDGYRFPDLQQFASFLAAVATPLAFAGMVLAASYLLSVYAARLDMDMVLADEDVQQRASARD